LHWERERAPLRSEYRLLMAPSTGSEVQSGIRGVHGGPTGEVLSMPELEGVELRDVERQALEAYRARFGEEPNVVASGPGRVNLIGEHTDYNGGFALPCAIDCRVAVAMGAGTGGLYSVDFQEAGSADGCASDGWAAYPRGVAWAMTDAGYRLERFQAAIAGDVPIGSGLSSSAAVETATALALDSMFGLNIPRKELALLCQQAENRFVGVNSGMLDQYASLLCREGAALFIDFRTLEADDVPLDLEGAGLVLQVCDTRVDRSLTSTGYNERRAACERAAATLGFRELRDAQLTDLKSLSGEELRRARHVVTEDERVLEAVKALRSNDFEEFGRLMYASHASLRDDYEVSTRELDAYVECARQCGAHGARLTGAGFGGCAIALIGADRAESLREATIAAFKELGFKEPYSYTFRPAPGAEVVQ